MPLVHDVFSILSSSVLLLLLLYFAGKIVLTPFEGAGVLSGKFTYFNSLLYVIAGAVGVVTVYSIVRAHGITVNLYFLLVFLFLLIRRFLVRKHIFRFRWKIHDNEIKLLLFTLLALVLLTLVQMTRYGYFNPEISNAGYSDYFFYTCTAEKMTRFHVEGINFENIPAFSPRHYRMPYHYFDLWLNAFIQEISSLSKTDLYLYVFTPISATFCFLTIATLFSMYGVQNRWIQFAAAFFIIFYFSVLPFKSGSFFRSVIIQPKIFPTIVFCGIAFTLLYKKETANAFLALTFMPIMNVLAAPAVLLSIGLAGLYTFTERKYKQGIHYLAICFFLFFFFLIFYLTWGNVSGTAVSRMPAPGAYLKETIRILFRDYLVRIWFFCLPLIFFLAVNYKAIVTAWRSDKKIYYFLTFLLLAGTSLSAAFHFFVDAFQFDYFPTYAALVIFIACFIALYIGRGVKHSNLQKLGFLMIAFQVLFSFYSSFRKEYTNPESRVSNKFIKEVTDKLPDQSLGGLVYSGSIFKYNEWANNPFVAQDGYFIGLVPKTTDWVLLSLPEGIYSDPKYATGTLSLIKSSEFFRFASSEHEKGKTFDDYQFDYIRKRKVGFLILEKGALLGDRVKTMVKDIIEDKVSGIRLVLLNNS